jgi:pimeloyl-ACP methyl ester carboxylesterase
MPVESLAALRVNPRAASRGPLWSALSVALATVGGSVPRPNAPGAAIERLRRNVAVDAPLHGEISVLQTGDAKAMRLILVHGTPGSASGWADFLLDPPPHLDVVALDRPGFGSSQPDRAVTSIAAQAAAVDALLPTDGRRAVLLGHSLGGAIVARVAAEHPQRVAALVLLAASLDPALERIHPLQRFGAWPGVRSLLPRALRNANEELLALEPELRALADWLPRISVPVLIVHGTHDDLVPVANVAYAESMLTGSACVTTLLLDGRNHFLPWNSADRVRDAIHRASASSC